jgi:hypothetical protein
MRFGILAGQEPPRKARAKRAFDAFPSAPERHLLALGIAGATKRPTERHLIARRA